MIKSTEMSVSYDLNKERSGDIEQQFNISKSNNFMMPVNNFQHIYLKYLIKIQTNSSINSSHTVMIQTF